MIYQFARFQVDDDAFRLLADGSTIALEPKALRLLLYLIQNRGRLVRKKELLDKVWEEAAVSESSLTRSVGLLRKTLDDDSREPRFIETVPTAGYRFIADVVMKHGTVEPESTPPPAPEPSAQAHAAAKSLSSVRVAGVMVVCLAAVGFGWMLISRREPQPIRSLAVLPLSNFSGDPSQEYFADGMTDELTTELAGIPNLRVVSHTSVMAGSGANRTLPDIARRLDVDAIVEGSIVRSGNRIRITAQLIDARTDRHLWAQSFEGSASDVLALQDSVAQQIATQARLVLAPPPPHAPSNPAAHDAYLRGRYFFNKQDFRHSLESYEQAISLDPKYASAYAGYASALDSAATFGIGTPEELMPKAVAAAQHAIRLDPQNGEAYTALGSVQTIYTWDWMAAEQNLTRGIALNPNDPIAEFKYAVYLDARGRPQDAVTHMRRAVQLDPLSFVANRRLGATLYLARQYDAALAQLQRTSEMEDQPATIDNYLSLIYEQKGDRDRAVQHDLIALHKGEPTLDSDSLLGVYRKEGWQPYWQARSGALRSTPAHACTAYEVGVDELRVDELGHAFEAFQQALDHHCFYMALIQVDPLFDSVRLDRRYAGLLARMHQ